MKSIIGTDRSAKFILFRCDEDSLLPTLSSVKRLLGCKTASFYKSSGHYRDEIYSMSSALNVVFGGLSKNSQLRGYYSSKSSLYMTSVLRVNSETKRNILFDLQYSDHIVDHLFLTHESLSELETLCNSSCDLISSIHSVDHLIDKIDAFNVLTNKEKEIDKNVKEAARLLNSDCFTYFGEDALKHAESNFSSWHKKVKWNADN